MGVEGPATLASQAQRADLPIVVGFFPRERPRGCRNASDSPALRLLDHRQPSGLQLARGKRLAFCVVTNVEHYAFLKGIGCDPAKLTSPRFSRRSGAGRS
jgi:hypothetical protein